MKKIMLMLTTSSDLNLVGIDTFTGPSSVMRIPNGRTHLTTTLIAMGRIGDIGLKRIMIAHQNLIPTIWSQILPRIGLLLD